MPEPEPNVRLRPTTDKRLNSISSPSVEEENESNAIFPYHNHSFYSDALFIFPQVKMAYGSEAKPISILILHIFQIICIKINKGFRNVVSL